MRQNFLLPAVFRKIGWILFLSGFLLGILGLTTDLLNNFALEMSLPGFFNVGLLSSELRFGFSSTDIVGELIYMLVTVGGLFVGFAKEKVEDEFINFLRFNALGWAVWVNYVIFILLVLFVHDFLFLNVLIMQSVLLLIIFVFRFRFLTFRHRRNIGIDQ